MGRAPCCEKIGLKRGPWTPQEDQKLVDYVNENGHGSWRALPKKAGLLRCGKSCRLRWTNYLRPDIKRGEFSLSEEQTIIQLHALLGNRWSAIASHLPKRTDNEIKNYWNTHLKKKLVKMGLDPATHKPTSDNTLMSSNAEPKTNAEVGAPAGLLLKVPITSNGSSATSHMAQWESARLEAEARLAQESQLRSKGLWRSGLAANSSINAAPLTTLPPSPLTTLPPWSAPPFSGMANTTAACADALKALNAVELMHVLHNWEKSLQGQAGMMWPEAWRLPGVHFPLREAQAESSSCSSHCSDANTNNNNTTPALATGGSRRLDHWSPTSTLCSLDSHSMKQKGLQSPLISSSHSCAHVRKLSWSDGLALLPPKPEVSVSLPMSKVSSGFCLQGVGCKMEEDSGTFSSLMHDAVFGTDATANAYMSCLEEPADASPNLPKEHSVGEETFGKVRDAYGGVSSGSADDSMYAKMFVTCPGVSNNAGDDGTDENISLVLNGEVKDMAIEEGESGATSREGGSISKKELLSDASALHACTGMQDGAGNGAAVLVNEGGSRGDPKEGEPDHANTNSDNKKNDDGVCRKMDLEGVEDGVADRNNNADSDDNNRSDGSCDEGKSMRIGGEMVGAEVFKDLPKLKSKVSTPHLTSYCGLLSEDIPDYWSSIMLKEPTLQQVDMTF